MPCFCSFVMASAAKRVKHPPKHIRNHMQHIYKGLHKHANITLTCLHDCMSLYTYFRNHSSTTGTWPNFWQTVFNFWQLTHQGDCARWGASHSALVPGRTPAAAAEFVAGPSDGAWSDTGFQSRICDVLAGVCTACMRFDMESCSDVDDFDDSVSEEAFQFSCRNKGSNVRSMATPARPPGP